MDSELKSRRPRKVTSEFDNIIKIKAKRDSREIAAASIVNCKLKIPL